MKQVRNPCYYADNFFKGLDLNDFHFNQILEIYFSYFLDYCGIQYQAYSATSPDSFVLDDVTATAVNVS